MDLLKESQDKKEIKSSKQKNEEKWNSINKQIKEKKSIFIINYNLDKEIKENDLDKDNNTKNKSIKEITK